MPDDTYESFDGYTREDVLKAIKQFGSDDNMEGRQNSSPSVREFLDLVERWPLMTFHGYIIHKPRSDYRVSIEGFHIEGLSADEALDLMEVYGYADECSHTKQSDGTYAIHTWWD